MTIRLAAGLSYLNGEPEIRKNFLPIAHNFDYVAAINGRYEGYNRLQPIKNQITRLERKLEYIGKKEIPIVEGRLSILRAKLAVMQEEYNRNPDPDYSTDGSTELLKSLPNCEVIDYAGYQPDKRQKYLDACKGKDIDYLMIIDSDEYPHPDFCNWDYFRKDIERIGKENPTRQVFYMWYWVKKEWIKAKNVFGNNKWIIPIRIIRNPHLVRYAFGCHYYFMLKGQPENGSIGNLKARGWKVVPRERHGEFACNKYIPDGVRLTSDSLLRNADTLKIRLAWATYGLWKERDIFWAKSREILAAGERDLVLAAINREDIARKQEKKLEKIKYLLTNR